MKVLISVLVTLIAVVQGADPTINPTTSCGKKAKVCYDNSKTKIDKGFAQLDLQSACKEYATQYNCLNDLTPTPACQDGTDPDLEQYKKVSASEVDGVCGTDGTIGTCGKDLSKCMAMTMNIKKDFDKKESTKACQAVEQFESCVRLVVGSNECPDKYTQILKAVRGTFAEDELLAGCDSQCGKKAGECTKSVSGFFSKPLSEVDFSTFCKDAYTAIGCIKNLGSNDACTGQKANLDMADKLADSWKKYLADYCDASGQPSACSKRVGSCSSDLKSLDKSSGTTAMCQATAKFLECVSVIPCKASLKTFIDNNRLVLETDEKQNNCPTVGTCGERIKVCGQKENEFMQKEKGENKDEICDLTYAGLACFDVVRNDLTCKTEYGALTTFENAMKKTLKSKCKGSVIQASLLLIIISLAASLRKLL